MTTNTLYNGDCLEVMKDIPDKSINLVLCDLPNDAKTMLIGLWMQYKRVLKPNGTVLLFGTEPFASAVRMSDQSYRYDWVWEKTNYKNLQYVNRPMKVHETISVFYDTPRHYAFSEVIVSNMERLGLSYNDVSLMFPSRNGLQTGWLSNKISGKQLPSREQWKKLCEVFGIEDEYDRLAVKNGITYNVVADDDNRYHKSVLRFNRETGYHPMQKPVPLLEFLIRTHSNEGETVLDNCMGSGSTGVACVNTGRNFIGIELDRKYYMVANNRIDEAGKRLF